MLLCLNPLFCSGFSDLSDALIIFQLYDMTRVPVDWNHINKPPYSLLGGNMKKVGACSGRQPSSTASHCADSSLCCRGFCATDTVLGEKKENIFVRCYPKEYISYITLVSTCGHLLVICNLWPDLALEVEASGLTWLLLLDAPIL